MRIALLAALLLSGSYGTAAVHRDIAYARTPHKELLLDLYTPVLGSGPYPVVLYVHGGGWSGGSKEKPPTDRLVRLGYAVASINYRLSHEANFPAQIHDCKAAVRWLRANGRRYSLDTGKIVAWGGSAGGHLVALLATSGGVKELEGDLGNPGESSRIQGVIDFFGPTDFFQLNNARVHKRPDSADSPEARLVGGLLNERRDAVSAANPITHLTRDDPPMLILHGDQDDLVPPHQSELLATAARKIGLNVEHHVIPGRGHGFRTGRDIDHHVDAFLAEHLAPPAIGRHERFEASFNQPVEYVMFTSPSGKSYEVPAFGDGDRLWRVRFSPDETGNWKYTAGPANGALRCVAYTGASGLLKHGALRVSSDGRHFEHADGTPFFWLGDTVWNGPLLADMRDWRTFLADRQKKGFSVIQFVTTPWSAAVGDATGRVAYRVTPEGKLRIDPTFFQRMDGFVDAINDAGMIAAPILLWAHTSQPKLNPGVALADEHAIELARYMIARWGAHQIVWFLNGDGQYLRSAERWKKLGRAVFARAHPNRLSSMHPARMTWMTDAFAGEPWFHFTGYQSGHRDDEQHLRWLTAGPPTTSWRRERPIPELNIEPNYEAHRSRVAGATHYFDHFHLRRAAYWSVLAAPPAGFTYGAHGIWSWETQRAEPLNHIGTGIAPAWSDAMRLPGSGHMLHLKTLLQSLDWWKLRPAQDALAVQPGEKNPAAHVSVALYDAALIAYTPVGGAIALRPEAIVPYPQAQWYDPRTGKSVSASGTQGRFTAPDGNDWVLVLKAR